MHAILTNLTIVVGLLPQNILYDLAAKIPKDYKRLAINLSIDSDKLDALMIDNKGNVTDTAFQALLVWNKANAHHSMCELFNILQKELSAIGRNELAETIYAG